jgi:hypothetical protein
MFGDTSRQLLARLGAVAVVAAMAAGCVNASADPSQTSAASMPAGFYLRAWQTQALAPQYTFPWLPMTTIADGKYIDGNIAVPAIYPGPLYVSPVARSISGADVNAIVAEAQKLGLLGSRTDFNEKAMPGSITAHISITIDGATRELTGSAAGMGAVDGASAQPGTAAAFDLFWQKLSTLNLWLTDLGQSAAYQPERLAVLTMPLGADDANPAVTPGQTNWPLTATFADFGTPYGGAGRCAVVTGADLAKVLPVVQAANAITRFVDSAGQIRILSVRALVPGEGSLCAA